LEKKAENYLGEIHRAGAFITFRTAGHWDKFLAGQLVPRSRVTYKNDARYFAWWLMEQGLTLETVTAATSFSSAVM